MLHMLNDKVVCILTDNVIHIFTEHERYSGK